MPLINYRSDLTALQYGNDRPGGGSSGQPYIQAPNPANIVVPAPNSTLALFDRFYNANKNTLDYPVRGGILSEIGLGGTVTATLAGQIDRRRIQAFLEDKSRGTIFLLKQRDLQLSNPNIQVPSVLGLPGLGLGNEFIANTRVYNSKGETTLLQVEVQGSGTHIQRHGLSPRLVAPFQNTYEYFARTRNTEITNRLAILAALKIQQVSTSGRIGSINPNLAGQLQYATTYGISPINSQILNYTGGPGSLYGVGFTTINRFVDSNAAQQSALAYNALTLTYQDLANQKTTAGRRKTGAKIQDFRAQLNGDPPLPANSLTVRYNDRTRWYNDALKGAFGKPEIFTRISYTEVNPEKVDSINFQVPYKIDLSKDTPWSKDGVNSKDIIKFAFECLSNDNIDEADVLLFRAYLSGFSDNHQADLNSFKYQGRGETFRTYQGFDRSVSFSFKIAAQSRSEMLPLYKKLNQLASQVYPDYSPTSQFMRGSVIRLTIGDYLYRVPGFLESINITVGDDSPWEIALYQDTLLDSDMNQLPQVLNVQCSFKPIHDFLPRRVTQNNPFVPLIGQRNIKGTSDESLYGGETNFIPNGWLSGSVEPLPGAPSPDPEFDPIQTSTSRRARRQAEKAQREAEKAAARAELDSKLTESTTTLGG